MDNTKRAIADEVTEKEIPRAAYEGVLTIDVDAQVESMEEQEDARWHQLLNAHRTRKVLTGQLGGIEKLESGWMVAVTYYNGFRIIIPMNEMMINLSGDGRENADTLNRQVRIANNMLGCAFYLMPAGWDGDYNKRAVKDGAFYAKWRKECLGDEEEIQPLYRALTRENIEALGFAEP